MALIVQPVQLIGKPRLALRDPLADLQSPLSLERKRNGGKPVSLSTGSTQNLLNPPGVWQQPPVPTPAHPQRTTLFASPAPQTSEHLGSGVPDSPLNPLSLICASSHLQTRRLAGPREWIHLGAADALDNTGLLVRFSLNLHCTRLMSACALSSSLHLHSPPKPSQRLPLATSSIGTFVRV